MRSQAKERIYLLIMTFCVLMCVLLLYSVFAGKPILVGTHRLHAPTLRNETVATKGEGTAQSSCITESQIRQQIAAVLPSGFGAENMKLSIAQDGSLTLGITAEKADVKRLLTQMGAELSIKESLLLGMLPRRLELEAIFQCLVQEDGLLTLQPESFSINGKTLETSAVPQAILALLNAGVNIVLQSTADYSSLQFIDGAILLQ